MEPNEERWLMSYARPGKLSDIKTTLHVGDLTFNMPPFGAAPSLDLNTHLYLTLGERMPDLQAALTNLSLRQGQPQQQFPGQPQDRRDGWPRFAGFETDAELLPEHWFGYQGVDVMFLSTRDKDFLLALGKDNDAGRARLKAIAQWVRRGGRLVVHISPRNQDVLFQVLNSTVWQPPLPVAPPREGTFETQRLQSVEGFAAVQQKPFAAKEPLKLAMLAPAKMPAGVWEVLAADTDKSKPLIARMPYGLGSVVYLAFPLDDAPFTTAWAPDARVEFLKRILSRFAPRVSPNMQEFEERQGQNADLSTQLQKSLDQFDIRVIPFGYVALFIIIYIVIVGPLDFLLLKYVFKRLEWTWFTFPTVVIAVSIAAYYTAYAIKGNDLKINKVDVVDIDLRTNLDGKGQMKKASLYGQSFFTILSPRIQNYTIGVEPNPAFWGQEAEAPLSADMMTWLGRADAGFGGMGARGSGQGFFRKPYRYNADASGLLDVPIPVWTTKSFHATWEVQGAAPPIEADLRYHQKPVDGKNLRLAGKLTSKLPIDLENAWILYLDQAFRLEGGLPKGSEKQIALEASQGKKISEWSSGGEDGHRVNTSGGLYNPSPIIRQVLFSEWLNVGDNLRNHGLRSLDMSWRLQEDPGPAKRDERIRDAILVARTAFAAGSAEHRQADVNQPLPANLWLGALPGDGGSRPELAGILAQDTFVRVIIPVRPGE
jgi:hypothetical protein